jgi:YggT family protein
MRAGSRHEGWKLKSKKEIESVGWAVFTLAIYFKGSQRYHDTSSGGVHLFTQIISLLLDVAAGLVGGACLLRLIMQWQRIPFNNPIGRFIFAVSDWLVLPLRRWLPAAGRLDTSSLAGAWLAKLAQFVALWLLSSGHGTLLAVLLLSVMGLAQLVISGLSALILIYAVLSWVQPGSMNMVLIERLCQPWLAPIRRVVPLIGGVDLSSLVLLLLLQIAGMVLGALQMGLMH